MARKSQTSIACTVVLSLALASFGLATPASAKTTDSISGSTTAQSSVKKGSMSDEELDKLLRALESLPEDLKTADPGSTSNYEERLNQALLGIKVNSGFSGGSISSPAFNLLACSYELISLVVQYGIPVGKVIGWIRDAKAIYGSVKGIWAAIQGGSFTAKMGPEAAEVFKAILGLDGVIVNCFS